MDDLIGIIVSQTGEHVVGERYVGTTHAAIQSALTYCNSMGGGKVFIEKGTYDIQVPINLYSNIEIYGEPLGTILRPSFVNTGNNAVFSAIGTSGNELENIYIHDLLMGNDINTKVGKYGIYCSYVGKGNTTGLTSGTYSRYDINTAGSSPLNKVGIRIENCFIQNNNLHGIYISSSSNNIISRNTIQMNGSSGFYLSSINNSIIENTIQNNNNHGIQLSSGSNNTLTGNIIQNNAHGVYVSSSSNNNTMTGNTVQNNSGNGIYFNSSNNNTISGNTVQNNGNYGINLSSSPNNTITGNTLQNNNYYGIYLSSSTNNTIMGNTMQNNGDSGIILNSSNSYNTITGNTAQNNGKYGINLSSSSNNTIAGNIAQTNSLNDIYLSSSNVLVNGNVYGTSSFSGTGNVTTENIQQV